jgi:hypothetical protein
MLSTTACPELSGKFRHAGKNLDFRKYCLIIVYLVLFSFNAFAQNSEWIVYNTSNSDLPDNSVAGMME